MKYWRKPLDRGADQTRLKQEKVIINNRCKGCGFCIAFCPRGVLQFSEDFNAKGYHYPEVIDSSKCADCHFCDALCPEFAIYSVDPGKGSEKSSKGGKA
jgi:2-oxoglutarate ferredoxin oxidoreductase subunit delta